jgi:hypothetical protein
LGAVRFVARVTLITVMMNRPAYPCDTRPVGMILPRDKQGIAMTDLSNGLCELHIDEMSGEELGTVTGGSMINLNNAINAVRNVLAAYDAKFGVPIRDIATELH